MSNLNEMIFPDTMPDITITRLQGTPFSVDCRELRWWFMVPEANEKRQWCIYDYPSRTLTSSTRMMTTAKAKLHDIDCYEIFVDEWEQDKGWLTNNRTFYARVDDHFVQWIGQIHVNSEGTKQISTFLDDDFVANWGNDNTNNGDPRIIKDEGRFALIDDNHLTDSGGSKSTGCGVYKVDIGDKTFECLRVVEPNLYEGILIEAYIMRNGDTVLCRRYNEKRWAVGADKAYNQPWDVKFPNNHKLTVDETVFVHWYDCLTDSWIK